MKLKLPNFLVNALINHAKKTPFDHLGPNGDYMERYWVLNPKGFFSRWLTARVHIIKRGDADRHLHDHPWSYTTIILEGGYTEITHWDTTCQMYEWAIKEAKQGGVEFNHEMNKWELRLHYTAGDILCRKAGFPHRLEVAPGEKAITCFIMGNYQNKWGFHTPEGKIYWRDYLDKDDVTRRAKVIDTHYKPKAALPATDNNTA